MISFLSIEYETMMTLYIFFLIFVIGKTITKWRLMLIYRHRPLVKRSRPGLCNVAKGRLIPLILPHLATRLPYCIRVCLKQLLPCMKRNCSCILFLFFILFKYFTVITISKSCVFKHNKLFCLFNVIAYLQFKVR